MSARAEQQKHLELCNEVYEFQIAEGGHFHIEQPQGSEVFEQPVMGNIVMGTLRTVFDMCEVGKLKVPKGTNYLRKRSVVRTTSRELHESLDARYCNKRHNISRLKEKFDTWENGLTSLNMQLGIQMVLRRCCMVSFAKCWLW